MFKKYKEIIAKFEPNHFHEKAPSLSELQLAAYSDHKTVTYYAPFEYINRDARILFVGITPGREQMNNALRAVCEGTRSGMSDDEILRWANSKASFSGEMRAKLVSVLDHHGFHKRFKLASCDELWNQDNYLANFTSALKYPVFVHKNGKELNYTGGSPNLCKFMPFRERLHELAMDIKAIPGGFVLPFGDNVANAIQVLVDEKIIPLSRVLNAEGKVAEFPHPSGSNNESLGLALMRELEPKDVYAERKYSKYVEQQLKEGKPLMDRSRYLNTRNSYWERARLTRVALETL